ncbi:TERF1-interacting nuclear factor 2 isoform X2 [Pygocentrus nattereri]|uniref:TERF1-interacting nuclear factor 2 isoform X2 n=1 Tax=Pygocentrus nattereri TaxID=42514 RepID=UPI00081432AA|nr:TERF1-interacting nuclear factor 2 isoform X2 [Pygocentrus nattereri]
MRNSNAPPLRLVSAAVWKVMQQRDVRHYGKLEEFVTSVSETVPGLLNYRHQAKLTLGLRAQLILEQLHMSQSPDPELILPQLERLRAPTLSKGKRKDQKVEMAVKNFHTLVHTLLKSPASRRQFFQEEFDSKYGPQYNSALEKLLWEFLTRLDQLLPVPDLAQTVSWLSAAPAVLEECARSATQPQLLRTLLQHEKCLRHLDSAASVPSSTGDSILSSLSLPPSGRVRNTNRSGSAPTLNLALSPATSTDKSSSRTVSQIAPVIGTISGRELAQRTLANQDILGRDSADELMNTGASSYTRTELRSCPASEILKNVPEEEHFVGNMLVTVVSQTSTSSEAEDTDEAQMQPVRRSAQRRSSGTRVLEQDRKIKEERLEDDSKTCPGTAQDIVSHEGQHLPAVLASCMKRQLRVVIPRLDIRDVTQLDSNSEKQITKSPSQLFTKHTCKVRNGDSVNRKRKLDCTGTPEKNLSGTTKKQVCAGSPCIPTVMLARMDSSEKASPVNESTDDIVVDSEDEVTENVKGRRFSTRYCKTKNNTYVPTLQEFWTPVFFRRELVSPGNG